MRTIGEEPVAWRYRRLRPPSSRWKMTDDKAAADARRDQGYLVQPLYVGPEPVPEKFRHFDPADLTTDDELAQYWRQRKEQS